jgi:hypothetical protein
MDEKKAGAQLAAILWTVAAVLACIAASLRYSRSGEIGWSIGPAGFAVAMAVGAWVRARRPQAP